MTDEQIVTLWRAHQEVMSFSRALEAIVRQECAGQAPDAGEADPMPLFDDWPGGWPGRAEGGQ